MRSVRILAAALVLALACAPQPGRAWGHDGHLLISLIAAQSLPDSVPAFLRTPQAAREIELLGPEADLLKGAGRSFDRDEGPGHYVDLDDDGRIAGIAPSALPPDREAYDTRLRAAGSDQYKTGYLPYSLIDRFEVVRQDFAYWRIEDLGARTAASQADRDEFARLRTLREALVLRDIGYWSHFVADASQPLHTTSHYDGWLPRFPGSKGVHAHFETDYVRDFITADAVRSRIKPFAPCGCTIEQAVGRYLTASNAQVIPLYELFEKGAFASRTEAGVSFTADRLAFGATELRNLIVEAWIGSEDDTVGYPPTSVRDVESGKVAPTLRGIDGG